MMMMMMSMQKKKKHNHHTDQPNHRHSYAAHMNDIHFPLFYFSAFLFPFLVRQTVSHNLRTPTFVQIPTTKIHFVVTTVSLPVMEVGSDIYQKWLLQLGMMPKKHQREHPKTQKNQGGQVLHFLLGVISNSGACGLELKGILSLQLPELFKQFLECRAACWIAGFNAISPIGIVRQCLVLKNALL